MRQVLLFFIALFALLPFIRAFRCGAQTNITFVPDVAAALSQYGDFNESSLGQRKRGTNAFDQGADKVGTDLRQPWPVWPRHNNQNPHVIHYCYETPYVRSRLNCVVTEAIDRWYRKLNSGVFRDKTDIKFREYHNSAGMPHYCFDGRQPVGWNQRVRPDALRISLDNTRLIGAQATLGYEVAGNWKAGRHQLAMADPSANHHLLNVLIVTHELAHVFGMNHEFQRSDRDEYLFYQCKNIDGFDDVVNQAHNEDATLSLDAIRWKLCNEKEFAKKYKFASMDFMKNHEGSSADEPGGFDIDSITMYGSGASADLEACFENLDKCVLAKYSVLNGRIDKSAPVQRIDANIFPSDGDARFVMRYYPKVPPPP